MKNFLLSALVLSAFNFVTAQETPNVPINSNGFKQGDLFITGSIGVGSEATGDNKTNSFNVSPKVGYFLTDGLAAGISLGYASGKTEVPLVPDIKSTEFSIGAFGRYYLSPAKSFSIFGEVGVDYIHSKIKAVTEDNSNAFRIALAPGINYFVSENFALEAKFGILSYRTDKPDANGVENTDSFNFGLNFSDINFGIIYRF